MIRPLGDGDVAWAEAFLDLVLGGRQQARRGELIDALGDAGLVAETGQDRDGPVGLGRVGLVAWRLEPRGRTAEVTVLAVAPEARRQGIGRALLEAAVAILRAAGIERAWLVTTNDNQAALRLYQRTGWRLTAVRRGAVDVARETLKPSIPEIGDEGIAIHDELDLEIDLG